MNLVMMRDAFQLLYEQRRVERGAVFAQFVEGRVHEGVFEAGVAVEADAA